MRRCFVALLIALLPFQSVWAAMASYCGHAAGMPAEHVGHHEHRHFDVAGAQSQGGDAAEADRASGSDFSCDHCHAGCAVMPAPAASFTPRAAVSLPAAAVEQALRTLAQAPPERPQWVRLA